MMSKENKKEILLSFDTTIELFDASRSVMFWESVAKGTVDEHEFEVGVGVAGRGGVVFNIFIDGHQICYVDCWDLLMEAAEKAATWHNENTDIKTRRKAAQEKRSALGPSNGTR